MNGRQKSQIAVRAIGFSWTGISLHVLQAKIPLQWISVFCVFQCSVTCGKGMQSRVIQCMHKITGRHGNECFSSEKPAAYRPCHLHPCNEKINVNTITSPRLGKQPKWHFLTGNLILGFFLHRPMINLKHRTGTQKMQILCRDFFLYLTFPLCIWEIVPQDGKGFCYPWKDYVMRLCDITDQNILHEYSFILELRISFIIH